MPESNPYSAPESDGDDSKRNSWPVLRDVLIVCTIVVLAFWGLGVLIRYLVEGEFSWF